MHGGMAVDPIQGHGHETLKVSGSWKMTLILKLDHNVLMCSGQIFDISPVVYMPCT